MSQLQSVDWRVGHREQRCVTYLHSTALPYQQLLEDIGALDEKEHLTSLGRHLAALPLPPALGELGRSGCGTRVTLRAARLRSLRP